MTARTPAGLRLRQGTRALAAFSRTVDLARAAAVLSPAELALFRRMRRSEQLHSLNVLAASGANDDPVLAAAALLHDAGKSRYPLHLWQRTLPVLVGALARDWVRRLSARDPRRAWWRPFAVYMHHPAWGAELAAEAGSAADVVWLVRHHADDPAQWANHPLFPLLVRLKAADDAN